MWLNHYILELHREQMSPIEFIKMNLGRYTLEEDKTLFQAKSTIVEWYNTHVEAFGLREKKESLRFTLEEYIDKNKSEVAQEDCL